MPPSRRAASSSAFIFAISSGRAGRPLSSPIAFVRSEPKPTIEARLMAVPFFSTLSRNSPRGSREPPSCPPSAVVMPWRIWVEASGRSRIWPSAWLCRSMKPGATTRPWASMTRTPAGAPRVASLRIARIVSPEIRIAWPVSRAPPLPSAIPSRSTPWRSEGPTQHPGQRPVADLFSVASGWCPRRRDRGPPLRRCDDEEEDGPDPAGRDPQGGIHAPPGISMSALARDLAVPANRISQIVNGKRAFSADTALRLGKDPVRTRLA